MKMKSRKTVAVLGTIIMALVAIYLWPKTPAQKTISTSTQTDSAVAVEAPAPVALESNQVTVDFSGVQPVIK